MSPVLNKDKISALFNQEAVYIGSRDAVPLYRVVELFGRNAAEFARSNPITWNRFDVGDGRGIEYLYQEGFFHAASYANVEKLLSIRSSRVVADLCVLREGAVTV